MNGADSVLRIFPSHRREMWEWARKEYENLEEIRLRADKPVLIKMHGEEYFLSPLGKPEAGGGIPHIASKEDLQEILNQVCQASFYAYEDEIRQGFLTVPGGHRIGIAGQAVLEDDGRLRTIKHISALNIRIAHEIKGVADSVLPYLYQQGHLCNTLIVSPPGCGKTTLLRDIIRQISDGTVYGKPLTVGVVDERCEIAGSYMGMAQNDLGIRTDVMDACPKVHGMMMLIRSMAPQVVAIDEIGSKEDAEALQRVSACGCRLVATIHGFDMGEVKQKAYMQKLLEEMFFERYIVLGKKKGVPAITGVYEKEKRICNGF